MKYQEIQYDLFKVNEDYVTQGEELYCLAHCISADFAMAGGIVLGFNSHFNMKNRLVETFGNVRSKFYRTGGFIIPIMVENTVGNKFPVFNMITKMQVIHKPKYENIQKALEDIRNEMTFEGKTKLAIPKIGCGIDGKDWKVISQMIKDVFQNEDIEILVCVRGKDE